MFDTTKLDPKDTDRYGTHEFGRHMLQARKMLEAGVRFVKVTSYGWDTHGDNFHSHRSLMPRFDQAFAAMIVDLHERGMLDRVLVIAMSEFGRTPRINGHIGHMFHTWFACLGIDTSKTEYDNHGQPLPLAHDGCHVVRELLA